MLWKLLFSFVLTLLLIINIVVAQDPSITVSPSSGVPFQLITISWDNFPAIAGDHLNFYFGPFPMNYPNHNPIFSGDIPATKNGSIVAIAPKANYVVGETYKITVQEFKSDGSALYINGKHVYASADFLVTRSNATATASKSTVNPGDLITISWDNFPGNPYDFMSIVWDMSIVLYGEGPLSPNPTRATSSGSVNVTIPPDAEPGQHMIVVDEYCAPVCGGLVDSAGMPIYASEKSSNIPDSGKAIYLSDYGKSIFFEATGTYAQAKIPIMVVAAEAPAPMEAPSAEQPKGLNIYLLILLSIVIIVAIAITVLLVKSR